MNALKRKIVDLIEAEGPISIAQYMAIALGDAEHGYYMRRDPLGRDFITAPEVSQIFGELIGFFFMQAWEDRRRPSRFHLVELGPGRGTLMADMLRAAEKVRPGFLEGAQITLVETSPALRAVQKSTLGPRSVRWVLRLDEVPNDAPLFLVANEFFDALPIRQFVKKADGWHEKMVASDSDDLRFALTPDAVLISIIPEALRDAPLDSVVEINPAAAGIVREIAGRIADSGGVALVVDYGHATSAVGDTLQAVKNSAFADPLAEPGEADLTAHVDFGALAASAREVEGYVLGPIPQGAFLERMGIRARAQQLRRHNPEKGPEIDAAVDRLTNPQQMGTLFKVLAIYEGRDQETPPGFDD